MALYVFDAYGTLFDRLGGGGKDFSAILEMLRGKAV